MRYLILGVGILVLWLVAGCGGGGSERSVLGTWESPSARYVITSTNVLIYTPGPAGWVLGANATAQGYRVSTSGDTCTILHADGSLYGRITIGDNGHLYDGGQDTGCTQVSNRAQE